MGATLEIRDTDNVTVLTTIDLGSVTAGSNTANRKLYLNNTGDAQATSPVIYNWNGFRYQNTNGGPVTGIRNIYRDAQDNLQTTDLTGATPDYQTGTDTGDGLTFDFPDQAWDNGVSPIIRVDTVQQTEDVDFTVNYNAGQVTFTASQAGNSIDGAYAYKNPQPGSYALTFPTVSTCSVNAAAAVNITADGATENTNVITGMAIIFSAALTAAMTATITVSDGIEHAQLAPDAAGSPGTWVDDGSLSLANIAASGSTPFWMRQAPPGGTTTTDNTRKVAIFAECTSA